MFVLIISVFTEINITVRNETNINSCNFFNSYNCFHKLPVVLFKKIVGVCRTLLAYIRPFNNLSFNESIYFIFMWKVTFIALIFNVYYLEIFVESISGVYNVFYVWWVYLLFKMHFSCSLFLFLNDLSACPMYQWGHVPQVNLSTPDLLMFAILFLLFFTTSQVIVEFVSFFNIIFCHQISIFLFPTNTFFKK